MINGNSTGKQEQQAISVLYVCSICDIEQYIVHIQLIKTETRFFREIKMWVFYCYLTISNYMHFGKLHYMKFSLLQSFESLDGTFPPVPMNSWGFQPGSVNAGLSMLNLEMS